MGPTREIRMLPLADAAPHVGNSDLLLFRRRGLIAAFGRSEYSHAAKAIWWGDDLFCVEVREWHGGRAVTLASQIKKFPGHIDIYRFRDDRFPGYSRSGAAEFMRRLAGCAYGYGAVFARRYCIYSSCGCL